jgi:glutathione S-transferase
MEGNMMKLYWAPQSRAFRALWMMEEAGCDYERVLIDIRKGAQTTPQFRSVNPMMKVPALSDGAAMVAESAAICAYVAERVPEANLAPPLGDPARGRYLHWLFFAGGCIEPAYTQKFTKLELASMSAGWGSFDRVMDVLAEALGQRPWILGERFSAADVMLGADLNYGMNIFKIVEPRPAFTAYIARCTARPAFQRASEIDKAGV